MPGHHFAREHGRALMPLGVWPGQPPDLEHTALDAERSQQRPARIGSRVHEFGPCHNGNTKSGLKTYAAVNDPGKRLPVRISRHKPTGPPVHQTVLPVVRFGRIALP
jgi:hypothetical protein